MANLRLSPEQSAAFKIMSDDAPRRLFYGGQAGPGKTFLGCVWQIHRRCTYAGTRGYIARPEQEGVKLIKEFTRTTFLKAAQLLGRQNDYVWNDYKNKIDFSNGSEILLKDCFFKPSDPDYERYGSAEYTDGFIDEGSGAPRRGLDILFSRTRYKLTEHGLEPKQLIAGNPADGYIKNEVVLPFLEGEKLPLYWLVLLATLESNPDKDFVSTYQKTLSALSEFDKARLLHGDWYALPRTGGEFYKHPPKEISEQAMNPMYPLHITFDFNVTPYITLLIHQIEDKKITQIDELCLPHPRNKTAAVCAEFRKRYPPGSVNGLYVYGDPSGRNSSTSGDNDYFIIGKQLARYNPQFRIPGAPPPVKARGNFIDDIVSKGFGGISFEVCSNCRMTLNDYAMVKEAPDGTKQKKRIKDPATGGSYEPYGHCTDANDYLITEAFKEDFLRHKNNNILSPSFTMINRKRSW